MDTRNGRIYNSRQEALDAGVPEDVLAELHPEPAEQPDRYVVKSGPFKGRVYQKNSLGQMVRVEKRRR